MISVSNVSMRYGAKILFEEVSTAFTPGKRYGLTGPNGAGKTTFALKYLPDVAGCRQFINADLIAAGLSPLAPEREQLAASRLYLAEIERCVSAREDFAFETTVVRTQLSAPDRTADA